MHPRTCISGLILLIALARGATAEEPRHLADALKLLKKVDLSHTTYEHGDWKVVWEGTCESHTDCSGLIDALLVHTYGYDKDAFHKWFGSRRPTATRYYDVIMEQKGFERIESVRDVKPGDVIVMKNLHKKDPKDSTGHCMLVVEAPKPEARKSADGREGWEVVIIDSSKSGHGPTDTRHAKGADGKDHDGLGTGVFRIYTDERGKPVGFSWSTVKASKFVGPDAEPLVVGRLKPGYKP